MHKFGPSELVLLDRDESGLHSAQLSIYGRGVLDTPDMVLANIREAGVMDQLFADHRPEVVIHAAALKQLTMLEQYPEEGWKTNVLETLNVLEAGWPVVVAGDFNAVREHLPFRRLVGERAGGWTADGGAAASSGLVDAAVAAGAGWQPTYRADRWFPPLIEIDHVLVSPGIEVGAVETVRVGGHAHLALVAWVQVR